MTAKIHYELKHFRALDMFCDRRDSENFTKPDDRLQEALAVGTMLCGSY